MAAHLTKKDSDLWRRLAHMSSDQGAVSQAIYCWNKVLRLAPDDLDGLFDRSVLYAKQEDFKKVSFFLS